MSAPKRELAQPTELLTNLWSFHYRKGAAFMGGIISAKSLESAVLIANEWCRRANVKKLTDPRPMILADESILVPKAPETQEIPVPPDTVMA